jgi:hypothetical protein
LRARVGDRERARAVRRDAIDRRLGLTLPRVREIRLRADLRARHRVAVLRAPLSGRQRLAEAHATVAIRREELDRAGLVVAADALLLIEHRGQQVAGAGRLRLAAQQPVALHREHEPHRRAEAGDGDHEQDAGARVPGHPAGSRHAPSRA